MMSNSERHLYTRSQYCGKHWLPKYRNVPPKTVFLLKPRQLTASTEDFPNEKVERSETEYRNKNECSVKNTPDVSNLTLAYPRRQRYDHLKPHDLPRCRRRAEIARPQYQAQINESSPQNPSKSTSDHVKCIGKLNHQSSGVYQFDSNERSRTVIVDESDAYYKPGKDGNRRKQRKPKMLPCFISGKKYEPYYSSCNVKCGVMRQMESRYLAEVEHRLCNAINIFVYKNGIEDQPSILIHIEPQKKNSMHGIMSAIQERVKFPIGYPKCLYTLDGTRLMYAYQLQHHGEYVVATNLHKRFIPLQYGRIRTPLMMMGKQSKHIRNLVHKYEEQVCQDEYENLINDDTDIPDQDENDDFFNCDTQNIGSKSNFMPKDISETDIPPSKESSDICIKQNLNKEEDTKKQSQEQESPKTFQDVGTTTIHVTSVDCIPEKICHRYNKYMENKSADNLIQRPNYFEGLDNGRESSNTKSIQCSVEKITKDYQNPFPSNDNILTASKRYTSKHGQGGSKKPLKPEYLLNTDEQAYYKHFQKMKGDSLSCQSLYGHHKNTLNESELKNQHWEHESDSFLQRKQFPNSSASNCSKKKVQFADDVDKGCHKPCPNLSSMPSQNSQTTGNSPAQHNIMYANASGDGINKLNILPYLSYNLSNPPQQPAFIIQPLQLPSAHQPPKLAVGPGRIGMTDPWSQQLLIQNHQMQNIPAQQIMHLIPPQNFQIASSSYPNLSVPGIQITHSNNDCNSIGQLYAISTSNSHTNN